jgi:hypothetical protein
MEVQLAEEGSQLTGGAEPTGGGVPSSGDVSRRPEGTTHTMQQLSAHESEEVPMVRYRETHLELVQEEYEFFVARDATKKKT